MRGKIDCYGLTDTGKVRKANEDQFLVADLNKSMLIHQTSLTHEDHTRLFGGSQGQLFLVADGMGGHAEGKRASTIAVQSMSHYLLNTMHWFFRLEENREEDLEGELKAALENCQHNIQNATESVNLEPRKMGTTLTMAYVLWPRLYVVHAGDSRCYLLRDSRLEQITTDHTVAQQLVEKGALSPEDAQESRWSKVLWNCVGGDSSELKVDVYKATLQIGDMLLLCTDGLNKPIRDEAILKILKQKRTAKEMCRQLVDSANAEGGPDNITVIIAHFQDARQPTGQMEEQAALEVASEAKEREKSGKAEPVMVASSTT
ncbi:MAG: PP2C family protein-serine/threonine phosphatase [Gemmataceae bacterium]